MSSRAAWIWVLTIASAPVACSSAPKLRGAGGQCSQVADCEKGLVCVDGRCSTDLSPIGGTEGPPTSEGGAGGDAPAE
jgi:hypothetical protein